MHMKMQTLKRVLEYGKIKKHDPWLKKNAAHLSILQQSITFIREDIKWRCKVVDLSFLCVRCMYPALVAGTKARMHFGMIIKVAK